MLQGAKARGECKEQGTQPMGRVSSTGCKGAGLRPDWPWRGSRGASGAPVAPTTHHRARTSAAYVPLVSDSFVSVTRTLRNYTYIYTPLRAHPQAHPQPSPLAPLMPRGMRKEKEGGSSHFSRPTWLAYPIGWPVLALWPLLPSTCNPTLNKGASFTLKNPPSTLTVTFYRSSTSSTLGSTIYNPDVFRRRGNKFYYPDKKKQYICRLISELGI